MGKKEFLVVFADFGWESSTHDVISSNVSVEGLGFFGPLWGRSKKGGPKKSTRKVVSFGGGAEEINLDT